MQMKCTNFPELTSFNEVMWLSKPHFAYRLAIKRFKIDGIWYLIVFIPTCYGSLSLMD